MGTKGIYLGTLFGIWQVWRWDQLAQVLGSD